MNKTRYFHLIVILLALLALSACSLGNQFADETVTTGTETPAAESVAEEVDEGTATPTPPQAPYFGMVPCEDVVGKVLVDENYKVDGRNCTYMDIVDDAPAEPEAEDPPVDNDEEDRMTADSGNWTPASKCTWLRANFPQTVEGIQQLGLQLTGTTDPTRIRTHVYDLCGDGSVYDGLIVLGPSEGHSSQFSINVPQNGAVDTYGGAQCTGERITIGVQTDTFRCLSGTVTAVNATYWPFLDSDPPMVAVNDQSQSASDPIPATGGTSSTCIDPVALATQNGWTYNGTPNQYGGLQVTVASAATLPEGWEADGPNGFHVGEFDTERELEEGLTITVYPPYSCREALGYSK